MKGMIGRESAGTIRLMILGMAAAALPAHGARAQATAGSAQPTKVMVMTKDTSGRTNRVVLITPLIDSLVKRLNDLPIGSAEFNSTNAALQAAFRELPLPPGGTFEIAVTGPRAVMRTAVDVVPRGTLGFTADGFNRRFVNAGGDYLQYFEYPTVVSIEGNSPASRAGVRVGDRVIAYNGDDVKTNWINMTQLLTPGRDITVKLRHDGDTRDVVMSVEKAPPALIADRRAYASMEERRVVETQAVVAAAGRAPTPPVAIARTPVAAGTVVGTQLRELPPGAATIAPAMNGVLGAAMTDIDPDLAKVVRGMDGKRGVLITRVPSGSVADRTGLRSGDVILRVDASEVATVSQFRVRMMLAEQSGQEKVKLTILRGEKTQEITYFTRER
jgi:membrane-associated protease RseP (regulator of RpoE activity)